jgi:hypothetical protein
MKVLLFIGLPLEDHYSHANIPLVVPSIFREEVMLLFEFIGSILKKNLKKGTSTAAAA